MGRPVDNVTGQRLPIPDDPFLVTSTRPQLSGMMSVALSCKENSLNLHRCLLLLFIALPPLSLSAQSQPPPATLRSLLLHELRTTHSKAEWFVPINTAVEGLTAAQANWQPPNGTHSAGQLAYHLLFWNQHIPGEHVLAYLSGISLVAAGMAILWRRATRMGQWDPL